MRITIRAIDLPGERAEPGVVIGLQVRRDVERWVPATAESGEWTTDIEVLDRDGRRDFRGPAVQGPKGERFLYLSHGTVIDGRFVMHSRAKLMLADAPDADAVVLTVHVADETGRIRVARQRPPAVEWAAG
jgi:hypothetical protein